MKAEKRNFRLKMHLICGTDDLRPIMHHIYFADGFMVSTDAHVLVKAAVQHFSDFDRSEVDILNGKFLHKNTFKKILSCEKVQITEEGILDLATKDVYKFNDPGQKYPNYEAVIPKQVNPIGRIGVNPATAMKLIKVLCTPDIVNVSMNFNSPNHGICIKAHGENEGALECVLMPVMLDN